MLGGSWRGGPLAAWLACVVLSGMAVARPARAQEAHTVARLIASSEVSGRFAHPVCHWGETLQPAEGAAFTYALVRNAHDPDRPMVLDTGGLLTPQGVARYAAQERPSSLAIMVQQLGYRALAFGLTNLASPRAGMLSVARELRDRGIPMIASNLRCAPDQQELCDVLVDASDGPSMHEVADRQMAVLAVLRQNVTDLVAPDRGAGIRIEPPKDSIIRLTRMARAQGADIVVAVVDSGITDGVIELASSLPEDSRPDLLLVSGGGELLFARPRTVQPVIVGAPEDDSVEVLIRESDLMRDGYEMLARPLEGRGISVGEPVLDWIDRIGQAYCDAWGTPLAGGQLDAPLDGREMLELATSIIRELAGADVAVLNRQVLDSGWRPAQPGVLTESDVYVALEYDEPLEVSTVDGDWLKSLAQNAESHQGLVTSGLTWTGTGSGISVKIDGHDPESRADYRVVTIRFLAAGGDGALPALPHGSQWRNLDDDTLRTVVLDYLRHSRHEDPRQAVSNPDNTLQWIFRSSADLQFSGSNIQNPLQRCLRTPSGTFAPPSTAATNSQCNDQGYLLSPPSPGSTMPPVTVPAYTTSLLNRANTLTLGVMIELAANAAAPDWTWQNSLNVVYRTAWVGTNFAEAADQTRGRSTLSWTGLRRGNDEWYVPDPMVDLFIETEINPPPTRTWHWFLVRPTAGVRLQLLDKLQLQLNGGFQVQPFAPTSCQSAAADVPCLADGRIEPGIGATLTLSPWDLLRFEDRYARLSYTLDYFVADLGNANLSQLRGQLDATFDLAGPLAFVFTMRLYVQGQNGQDIGTAIDATAGIRLGYLGRVTGP